jgi:DNA-binding response OmpR family regulator
MLKDNFESVDVQIMTFTDPEEGILQIERSTPDLVFLDYRIGNITGDDIAARLANSLVKVLITGDLMVHPKIDFAKIFYKPFSIAEMSQFIQECLALKRSS